VNLELRILGDIEDSALTDLHARAFGNEPGTVQSWSERLDRYSVSWVCAFDGTAIIGFVHACWDGGSHAFLLDTVVHPDYRAAALDRSLSKPSSLRSHPLAVIGCMSTTNLTWTSSTSHAASAPPLRDSCRSAVGDQLSDYGCVTRHASAHVHTLGTRSTGSCRACAAWFTPKQLKRTPGTYG
jgi:hypothetical protein